MNLFTQRLLSLLLLFLFFQLGFTQSIEKPWKISLGINVVDTYPTGDDSSFLGDSGAFFEEFLNVGSHWNLGGPNFSISRYVSQGFSLGFQGSLNKIYKVMEFLIL